MTLSHERPGWVAPRREATSLRSIPPPSATLFARNTWRSLGLPRASSCNATGTTGPVTLGYDPAIIAGVPDDVLASLWGVGNPCALGPIKGGERLLDFGCGAGVHRIVASHVVGETLNGLRH